MYRTIALPEGGFQDGDQSHILSRLQLARGQPLQLRGEAIVKAGPRPWEWRALVFAGAITVGPDQKPTGYDLLSSAPGGSWAPPGLLEAELVRLIMLALREFGEGLLEALQDDLAPRYAHDCAKCTYLGQHGEYDLYHCLQSGDFPTVIARYGSEGCEYTSGLDSPHPALRVAQLLAHGLRLRLQ